MNAAIIDYDPRRNRRCARHDHFLDLGLVGQHSTGYLETVVRLSPNAPVGSRAGAARAELARRAALGEEALRMGCEDQPAT